MIFEDELKCGICNKTLKDPIMLPCDETCCSSCIKEMNINTEKDHIDCFFCQGVHEIPKSGNFPPNKFALKLLTKQPKEIYRGEYCETLKFDLKLAQEELKSLETNLQTGADRLKDYCSDLINDVILNTENLIEHVKKFSESYLEAINDYEKSCLKSFDNEIQKDKTKEFIKETNDFIYKWNNYIKQSVIHDDEIKKGISEVKDYILRLKRVKIQLEKITFNEKYLRFEGNNQPIKPNILGALFYKRIGFPKKDNMQIIDFKLLYPKMYPCSNIMKIEILSNGSFIVLTGHISNIESSYLHLFSPEMKHIKSISILIRFNLIRLFKIKNSILTFQNGQICLYDKYLNNIKSNTISSNFIYLSGDDKSIVCLANEKAPVLNIFNWNLKLILVIYHQESITDPFYFPTDIKQFEVNESRYIFKHGDKISLMNKNTGELILTFDLKCDYFKIDESSNNIVAIDNESKKIYYVSLDGTILTENDLNDTDFKCDFLLDKNGNVILSNLEKSIIYIEKLF